MENLKNSTLDNQNNIYDAITLGGGQKVKFYEVEKTTRIGYRHKPNLYERFVLSIVRFLFYLEKQVPKHRRLYIRIKNCRNKIEQKGYYLTNFK